MLLNASADIRYQIENFPRLQPQALRDTPISAILLTNGDLDHCLGLLCLRESQPLAVYATERVQAGLLANVFLRTLERYEGHISWRRLVLGEEIEIRGRGNRATGLAVTPLAVPGKLPIHLAHLGDSEPGDNVGLRIRDISTGVVLAYFSSVGAVSPAVLDALQGSDCIFFDGTFWSDDELTALGVGTKRAAAMAHVPVGGPEGSLVRLATIEARRRIFVHVNNTNPLLRRDSSERAVIEAHGWEVAEDGLEISL